MAFQVPQPIGLYLTWTVVATLSVVCYCWLLCALRRNLAAVSRERLFPRQLRSLAMSGILLHLSSIPCLWTHVEDLENGSLLLDLRCATFLVLRMSSYWTVFQETHMVLTFFAQAMHWTTALALLNRSMRGMWLLGILMTLVDPNTYTCGLKKDPDFWVGAATSLCCAISLVSGSSMLYVVLRGKLPGRANQNFIRASVFTLIAPICYSMMIGANFQPRLWYSPGWYYSAAGIMKFSNGWMNTLAYALQSRYASRLLGRGDPDGSLPDLRGDVRDFASLGVAFGGIDIQDVLPWERSLKPRSEASCLSTRTSSGTLQTSKAAEPVVLFEDLYQ